MNYLNILIRGKISRIKNIQIINNLNIKYMNNLIINNSLKF